MFFKRYKIKKLMSRDLEPAIELWARSCRLDRYYQKHFKIDDAYACIRANFKDDVQNAILFGYAYGMFVKDRLIGLCLGCNVIDWMHNHPLAFMHLFEGNDTYSRKWFSEVNTEFRKQQCNLMYVFCLCVDEDFRRNHVATSLITDVVSRNKKNYTIISDLSNDKATSVWSKNGFYTKKLEVDGNDVIMYVNS